MWQSLKSKGDEFFFLQLQKALNEKIKREKSAGQLGETVYVHKEFLVSTTVTSVKKSVQITLVSITFQRLL